jgi:galactokinase
MRAGTNMIAPSTMLLDRVKQGFATHIGGTAKAVVQAPGRVNLIGEHTDYNDGFVLPCAIDAGTFVAYRPRRDRRVRVVALDMHGERDEFYLDDPIVKRGDAVWANYVRGMVNELLALQLPIGGADMVIAGSVPQGAGLSSSASLEVAVGQAFKSMFALDQLSATKIALAAQRAENNFVGCQCGVMDQLISANACAGHAGLIDCRSLTIEQVPIPAGTAVLIVHSGVERGLVSSEYNLRRLQCEAAARYFGVAALRDVGEAELVDATGLDALTRSRARHVVTENARTLAAAQSLARGDLRTVGKLMAESHVSMRDDFAITTAAIDHLVTILQTAIGPEGGARMTGGGFGGSVVALLPQSAVAAVCAAVLREYRDPQARPAKMYVCHPSAGAGVVDI